MDDKDKKLLFRVLKQAGITKVTIAFDGGGDSGAIEEITVEGLLEGVELNQVPVPPEGLTMVAGEYTIKQNPNMYGFIEAIAYSILGDGSPCDWINNDGGYGDIFINPEIESIHLDMNERITISELHEIELGFYEEPVSELVPDEVTNG